MREPTIVVLSPHHDDAVFALGGFLASRSDHRRIVITLFGGEAPPTDLPNTGWNRACGFRSNQEAEECRKHENYRALRALGVDESDIIDCGYYDTQYRRQKKERGEEETILQTLDGILSRCSDSSTALYAPISNDSFDPPQRYHVDHLIVHNAFLALARSGRRKNTQFYFYEDVIPYVCAFVNENSHQQVKELLEKKENLHLEPDIINISDRHFRAKLKSAACYGSQLDALLPAMQGVQLEPYLRRYASTVRDTYRVEGGPCEVVYRLDL
jgi:LmbE family N-acetylglucosaminyl deacetylase